MKTPLRTYGPDMEEGKIPKLWWRGGFKGLGFLILDGFKELGFLIGVYLAYSLTRGNLGDKTSLAFDNADDIILLEEGWGIFVELEVQSFFMEHEPLIRLANGVYTFAYYPLLALVGLWLYLLHHDIYPRIRNTFLATAAIGLLGFTLYPLAPPRFIPGFVDTLEQSSSLNYSLPVVQAFYNPYAAMPSIHFAWTFLAGMSLAFIAKSWWVKPLGMLWPAAILISTVATANHFFLDIAGGALAVGLGYGFVLLLPRAYNNLKLSLVGIRQK
jgi:membrane-associated phospholipid phosphatase